MALETHMHASNANALCCPEIDDCKRYTEASSAAIKEAICRLLSRETRARFASTRRVEMALEISPRGRRKEAKCRPVKNVHTFGALKTSLLRHKLEPKVARISSRLIFF
jgi:hypothetical protein